MKLYIYVVCISLTWVIIHNNNKCHIFFKCWVQSLLWIFNFLAGHRSKFENYDRSFFWIFKNRLYFLEQFWVHGKTERKAQSPTPSALQPLLSAPRQMATCYNRWTHVRTSPPGAHGRHLGSLLVFFFFFFFFSLKHLSFFSFIGV